MRSFELPATEFQLIHSVDERKSIQPLAARLVDSDAEIEGMRQRLQQAVVVADWDDGVVRSGLAKLIDKEMPDLEAIVFDDTGFPKLRDALRERGLQYIVGVTSTHLVWPHGATPRKPKRGANGRPPTRFVDPKREPISIQTLAESLPKSRSVA